MLLDETRHKIQTLSRFFFRKTAQEKTVWTKKRTGVFFGGQLKVVDMVPFFVFEKFCAILLFLPFPQPRLSATKILSAPPEPREWMRNLTSWVKSNGRKPLRHAAGERLQAERWKIAKRHLKMGKLNAAEKQFPRLYLWNPTFHNCSPHYYFESLQLFS